MVRAYFVVGVELDPVPGRFHEAEDWQEHLAYTLPKWYYPSVTPVDKLQGGGYPAQYVQSGEPTYRDNDLSDTF